MQDLVAKSWGPERDMEYGEERKDAYQGPVLTVLTRTVVVPSVTLTQRKFAVLEELEEIYREIVVNLVNLGFRNNVKSFTRLRKWKYRELRNQYPELPSHYIYTACQDASVRIKSFLKLKKKGIARTDRPEINRVSIWLDDHLWKLIDKTTIRIATHKGYLYIPLKPHKLYWKYINSSWRLRTQPRVRLDRKNRRILIDLIFEKEVQTNQCANVPVPVDINESNVTVKVGGEVFILLSDIKEVTLGYAQYRETIQSIRGDRHVRRTLGNNERHKKEDRRLKIANIIANTAKQLGGIVILEKLPKECPRNMIRNIRDKKLRHRIYQAGFRMLLKAIIEKCEENGVPYTLINPKGTSSICPFCGSKLMRGDAPRQLYCKKCGKGLGRDVVAVLNLERKATSQGRVPFAPMPNDSGLEVAVLPMRDWMRRKSLPLIPNETILTKMMQ